MEVTKRKAKDVLGEMVKNIDEESLARTREEMLNEIEYEYSFKRCVFAKKKFNSNNDVATIYKERYSPADVIGPCNKLCRQLKPTSDEDFLKKYLDYAEEHKDLGIRYRGITKSELYNTALNFFNDITNELGNKFETTFDECLDCLVCHIITETYTGYLAEEKIFNELINNGFTCENTTEYRQDSYYGIDFFTYVKGEKFAVQVKPATFFYAKKGHVKKDRLSMIFKYERALEKYKVKTLYAIYDSTNTKCERMIRFLIKDKNPKKMLFELEELINVEINLPKNVTFNEF